MLPKMENKRIAAACFDWLPRPDFRNPPSLVQALVLSFLPLIIIFVSQPLAVFGILGMPNSWFDVLVFDLDVYGLLREGKYITGIGTLLAFVRPTIPGTSPKWLRQLFPAIAWFFFSDESKVYKDRHVGGSSETIVYVNGICTTSRMARATGMELAWMLHKDVTVVHNPTDSALMDLAECIFGKLWIGQNWTTSVPCSLVLQQLMVALLDVNKTKVVLIAHSQGTIIASDVLWLLWDAVNNGILPEVAMQKLEIYNLANAAQWMDQRNGYPYIENICNQCDNVGMLGANAPSLAKDLWNISIAGDVIYPSTKRWGHMIQAHYLEHLKKGDYGASKLHSYMKRKPRAHHN